MDTKPYEFIGFGAMAVTKPYEFTGFGAMAVTHTPMPRIFAQSRPKTGPGRPGPWSGHAHGSAVARGGGPNAPIALGLQCRY